LLPARRSADELSVIREDAMSKKHHGGPAPVPPGNRPNAAPGQAADDLPPTADADSGSPFNDQDEQRRLGGYTGAGEHSIQQPGKMNDGGNRAKKG